MSQGLFFFLVFPKTPCMHLSSHPCMLHTQRISFFLIWLLEIYFVRCKDDLTVQPWSRATVAAADNFSDILRTEESNLRMVLSSWGMTASVGNHIPAPQGTAWRWLHDEGEPSPTLPRKPADWPCSLSRFTGSSGRWKNPSLMNCMRHSIKRTVRSTGCGLGGGIRVTVR
jgi:hypothetical protein